MLDPWHLIEDLLLKPLFHNRIVSRSSRRCGRRSRTDRADRRRHLAHVDLLPRLVALAADEDDFVARLHLVQRR